jgi:hypothetical protein
MHSEGEGVMGGDLVGGARKVVGARAKPGHDTGRSMTREVNDIGRSRPVR